VRHGYAAPLPPITVSENQQAVGRVACCLPMPRGALIISGNTRFRCGPLTRLRSPAWRRGMTLYGAGRFFCSSVVAVRLDANGLVCISTNCAIQIRRQVRGVDLSTRPEHVVLGRLKGLIVPYRSSNVISPAFLLCRVQPWLDRF